MCLANSLYAGCNNNMGVEVSWLEIKKLYYCTASLGHFIGCLCHFIKTAVVEEHMQPLQHCSGWTMQVTQISTSDKGDVGWSTGCTFQDTQPLYRAGLYL
jgi:hypothetical protein